MSQEEDLPSELKAFEAELAALVPRADRLDAGRVMYLAGKASAARRSRAWPAAFAGMSVVAATLAVMLAVRPEPQTIDRIVYLPTSVTTAAPATEDAAPVAPAVPEREAPRRTAPPGWSIESAVLASVAPTPQWLTAAEVRRLPYPRFRDYVLRCGVDALPAAPASDSPAPSASPRRSGDWQRFLMEKSL
ncbi:MAG: hypothetical protein JW809_19990 [Pirellulales bacterium]|nr:hypothetical protein [Pirellulales bacterium]